MRFRLYNRIVLHTRWLTCIVFPCQGCLLVRLQLCFLSREIRDILEDYQSKRNEEKNPDIYLLIPNLFSLDERAVGSFTELKIEV